MEENKKFYLSLLAIIASCIVFVICLGTGNEEAKEQKNTEINTSSNNIINSTEKVYTKVSIEETSKDNSNEKQINDSSKNDEEVIRGIYLYVKENIENGNIPSICGTIEGEGNILYTFDEDREKYVLYVNQYISYYKFDKNILGSDPLSDQECFDIAVEEYCKVEVRHIIDLVNSFSKSKGYHYVPFDIEVSYCNEGSNDYCSDDIYEQHWREEFVDIPYDIPQEEIDKSFKAEIEQLNTMNNTLKEMYYKPYGFVF